MLSLPEDEAPHPGQTHQEVRDQSRGARLDDARSSCHTHTHRFQLPQSLTTQKQTHTHTVSFIHGKYYHRTEEGGNSDLNGKERDADRGIQAETCSGQDDGQGDVPQRGRPPVVDVDPFSHHWDVPQQETHQQHTCKQQKERGDLTRILLPAQFPALVLAPGADSRRD